MFRKWIVVGLSVGVVCVVLGGLPEITVAEDQAGGPPSRNVVLTVYLLEGLRVGAGVEAPATLLPMVAELRELHPYTAFRVLDTNIIRTREGYGAELAGVLPQQIQNLAGDLSVFHQVELQDIHVMKEAAAPGADTPRRLHFGHAELTAEIPYRSGHFKEGVFVQTVNWRNVGITTQLDVPLNEPVLLGKINVNSTGDAVFFILEAKLID